MCAAAELLISWQVIYDFQIVTKLNNLSKDIYDGLKQLSIFKQRKVKQKHIYGKMMMFFSAHQLEVVNL